MQEIINLISDKLRPFFHSHNLFFLERNIMLLLLLIVFILFPAIRYIVKAFFRFYKRFILEMYLNPYFDSTEIRNATKFYINTKFQNVDPANENDLSYNQAFIAKQKLIPFFIKQGFKKRYSKKYFFLLADSGMGKTTFMINLYYKVTRSWRLNKPIVKLLPLGKKFIDEDIKQIDEKVKTILLLDGFDEDLKATINYKERLMRILELTTGFRKVIISSRTQFFSSTDHEPYETGLLKFGGDKGIHKFYKIYLSPFSDKDISKYLKKKYSWYNFQKKAQARKIISQCPNLMIRPMILANIDDLVKYNKIFNYTYQIYAIIIEKWIERESYRFDSNVRENFKMYLHEFSRAVALDIYKHKGERGELFIDANDIEPLAKENNIKLSELDLKTRSLLNRNSSGQYKFAHKSILEYFLALELYSNPKFKGEFDSESMPQSYNFYLEMCQDDVAAKSIYLNKSMPFSDSIFSGMLDKFGKIHNNGYYGDSDKITILNICQFDQKFFTGLTKIKTANIVITSFDDIAKILSVPNLTHLGLMNDYATKSMAEFRFIRDDPNALIRYIKDFKELIKRIDPNIDLKIKSRDPNFQYGQAILEEIQGKYDHVLLQLDAIYKQVIRNCRKEILIRKPDLVVEIYSSLSLDSLSSALP